MAVLIMHPTGNEFFRAAAKGFYDAAILHSVYTSVTGFPGSWFYRLSGFKIFADIRRRELPVEFKNIAHTHPYKEMTRLLAIKTGVNFFTAHEKGIFSVDAVYKSLDKHVAKHLAGEKQKGMHAAYLYEDGAYYTFKKAKALNIKCLYDLPIGYWRTMHAMLAEEKELNPAWAGTLEGFKDSTGKLNRKDEEIAMADKIFAASSFTLNTLKAYPASLPEVHVIPYGFPPAANKNYKTIDKKLKLLFVGGLSQRKGLSYLFSAVEGLNRFVELTIVGRLPQTACEPLHRELSKHRYINSLPQEKILELMRGHDVLILPSLFEGFGQVITEAMSQGTPVITTERTGGADFIKHNENGWLVKAGSSEEITSVLNQIISRPAVIAEAGEQAVQTAAKRPWHVYGEELAKAVSM